MCAEQLYVNTSLYLSNMVKTFSITVAGKVQGVFFRQSTKEVASELGITGTVRNQPDGSVHILATGTEDQLNKLLEWCKKGPSRAIVTGVHTEEQDLRHFSGFTIQR